MKTTKVQLLVNGTWIEGRRHEYGDKTWYTDMRGNRVEFEDERNAV